MENMLTKTDRPQVMWDGLFELVSTSVFCDTSSEFLYFV